MSSADSSTADSSTADSGAAMAPAPESASSQTWVLRVWLDDRPGALGVVAAVLGRHAADVVGFEVVERGAGRAIDEITIALGPDASVGGVTSALDALDGVDVESVRVAGLGRRSRAELLGEIASVAALDPDMCTVRIAELVRHDLRSDWCAVWLDGAIVASVGVTLDHAAVAAFATGAAASPASLVEAEGVLWAGEPAVSSQVGLLVGRADVPYLGTERGELAEWARLAAVLERRADDLPGHDS